MYTEMPVAVQIHQVFKSRWCGAYFQPKGLKVIPSLVWGEADTFWFSFDGIDEGSVVAVSTVGMRTEKHLVKPLTKYIHGFILKGGGAAGDGGDGGQRSFPKFPGWDPTKSPGEGYEWRGRGEPGSKTGNWFKSETKEWLRGDLDHPDPIGPHWDYGVRGEKPSY